jgi:large subunit ribosomal protein L3
MLQLVGKKIGMTHLFQENGISVPLTMLQVYDNCVLDLAVNENEDFDSLSVAFNKTEKTKNISKSIIGFFAKKSLPVYKRCLESRLKKGSELKSGDAITVDSVFAEGDKISVSGISSGKGFAGAMKRWNFAGLEATHGVSVSHRSHGSTGQRQDPGKTFKGKKMAGHMGVDKITVKNLEVIIIDKEKSVIAVKGAVPGNAGADVILKISKF